MSQHTTHTPNEEVLWNFLQLKQTRPQYIGVVYRRPDCEYNNLISTLTDQMVDLNTRNCDGKLIRDMNVDMLKTRETKTKSHTDFYDTGTGELN